jgi:hypothetical protein
MTDQSSIQAQSAQKREHATIHEHRTVQAEEAHHTMYLNINRNWTPKEKSAFFDRKVFFMKNGCIGMEYCGRVIVRSIEHWMSLGKEQS